MAYCFLQGWSKVTHIGWCQLQLYVMHVYITTDSALWNNQNHGEIHGCISDQDAVQILRSSNNGPAESFQGVDIQHN